MTTRKADAAASLKSYLERVETIEAERKEMGDEIRAIYAEAKAEGFDPKAIREMAKRRRKDPGELAEAETVLHTYMVAVGMATESPLSAAVAALATDTLARDEVIASLQLLVPRNGEIIAKVGGAAMRIWRTDDGAAFSQEYAEPVAAPAEKPGRSLKPATILTMVPKDSVKAAADAAERRSKEKKPADETAPSDEPEPVG